MPRHWIVVAAILLSSVINLTLLFRVRVESRRMQHDNSDLTQLMAKVKQGADELRAWAAFLEQRSDKLKALAAQLDERSKKMTPPAGQCAVIHKPASGCPKGYVAEKAARFTERDGSKQFACVSSDPAKKQCTDVLKAGESMEMWFRIPVEPGDAADERPKT